MCGYCNHLPINFSREVIFWRLIRYNFHKQFLPDLSNEGPFFRTPFVQIGNKIGNIEVMAKGTCTHVDKILFCLKLVFFNSLAQKKVTPVRLGTKSLKTILCGVTVVPSLSRHYYQKTLQEALSDRLTFDSRIFSCLRQQQQQKRRMHGYSNVHCITYLFHLE